MNRLSWNKKKAHISSAHSETSTCVDFVEMLPTLSENSHPFTYVNLNGTSYKIRDCTFAMLGSSVKKKAFENFNSELGRPEYFFTRNNACFFAILDYLENGELHMPLSVCPLVFKKEMDFWGIKLYNLETCCTRQLMDYERTERLLDKFSASYRRPHLKNSKEETTSSWEKVRRCGWDILDDPSSSIWASLCFAVKAIAVLLFVFGSIAKTHPIFQKEQTHREIINYIESNEKAFDKICEEEETEATQIVNKICKVLKEHRSHSLDKRNTLDNNKDMDGIQMDEYYAKEKTIINTTKFSENAFQNNLVDVIQSNDKQPIFLSVIIGNSVQLIRPTQYEEVGMKNTTNDHKYMSSTNTPRIKQIKPGFVGQLSQINKRYIKHLNDRTKRAIDIDSQLLKLSENTINGQDENQTHDHIDGDKFVGIHRPFSWLITLDLVIGLYFIFEYLLELIFAPEKLSHVKNFYSVMDLINIICWAWLYFYYEVFFTELKLTNKQFGVINAVQSIKTLKLFTVVKDLRGFRVLMYSIKTSYKDVLTTLGYLLIYVVIASYFMYYMEQENMESIPRAMWWTVVTVTTVGYGDIVPVTVPGKVLGVVCALFGILIIALLMPLFVNDFMIFNKHSKGRNKNADNTMTNLIKKQIANCTHK